MRRTGIIVGIIGVLLVVAAVGWSTLAVPRLVKFPLDTNLDLHYSGSVVTYVDARTGAKLAKPSTVPLVVDRRIRAEAASSSSGVALVDELLTLHFSGSIVREHNVYAIDRRTMSNVADSRAFTFAPGNPAAATGSYYVTLPMSITPGETEMRIWKPESGTTYPLVPARAGAAPGVLDGLKVAWFSGTLPMTPVAPYEQTALLARGLPKTISPAVVESQLSAAGVSISALTKSLLPVLSSAELSKVATVLSRPVALHYDAFGSGLVAAETRTGAIIELRNVVDGIAAAPDTSGLRTLVSVLSAHTTVPGVPAAIAALRGIESAPPQPVYELHYTETPAAVASMVRTANSQLRQIDIATLYVPIGLGALGIVLVVLGGFLWWRHRSPPGATARARGRGRTWEAGDYEPPESGTTAA